MSESTLKVETIPLAAIKPYWRNPRDNSAAVEAVKKSIATYGFNVPILLDSDHVIVAGHTRYKALLELGITEAPCIVLDLPPEKVKEFRIADNKTSELAGWNTDNLLSELREIDQLGDMQIYFGDMDLATMLGDIASFEFPSPTDIEKKKEELEGQHERQSETAKANYISMVCPACGESFSVDREEIKRILARPRQQGPEANK